MMMMVMVNLAGLLSGGDILLDGCEILLRSRKISRLQVLAQSAEGLRQGAGAVGLSAWGAFLQGCKIALRPGQITGGQILSQLLELGLYLRLLVILQAADLRKKTACNAGD